MVTTVSIQTVPASDLLKLAALPTPTMIFEMKPFTRTERQVVRAVVAASIPSARRPSRRAASTEVPALRPVPARNHLALNPGGTP